ncbi:MAG: D-glycero-beta-D-manno-heptose 1,7-bisphosphate 7-phosphatase [candidate division WOR-3 bacterium]
MQAVILCGGLGTRLGELTQQTPKPLLPVAGRPFLEWLVTNIRRFGFESILLLAGHLGSSIAEFGRQRDCECILEPQPLGTAGALRNARESLASEFLLLNGDTLFDFNYLDLMIRTPSASLGSIALLQTDDPSRYGSVILNEYRIISFAEKNASGSGLINGGVYFLRRQVADLLPEKGSLEQDVLPSLTDGRLTGFEYQGFFIDIGVPAEYERAQGSVPRHFCRPAAFFDRDGTLNEDSGYVHTPEEFCWLAGAKEAIKAVNDAGYLAIVVSNQAGIARGYYTKQEVHDLHRWMNLELRRVGAHIDAFYFCPHHPDAGTGQYRIACKCRKPEPGMILQAAREWNIDLEQSIAIGDHETDITAFHHAGVKRIASSLAEVAEYCSKHPHIPALKN